ncbi:MAG TPA: AAA family ATPase [Acidimicrobiales bacterium]|nr:AAA family ATPase [Acidimicrobiales bacterium]
MPVLLEREHELDTLRLALTEAHQGHGRMVLVEGSAGFGKTSLLRVTAEIAGEMGFTCLRARAGELERDFAYGCVRQLLEPVVARASGPARDRLFAGAAALAQPLFAPAAPAPLAPPADTTFSMLHGLYWLLNNLADDSPVALSVDDLQWADAESLRFLAYLAPRLDGLPVAAIASSRPGGSPLDGVARLATAPETTLVRPAPLSVEGTALLCERRLGGDVSRDLADACWQATGGNPFFVEALLHELREQGVSPDAGGAVRVRGIGPPAVAQAVLLRLSDAPATTSALVRATAVLGDGAALTEAARLAGIPPPEAARAHDLLARLEILTSGEALEFAHPIVREAVYADIGPRERAEAHARAAGVLAAMGASDERIAAQLAEAEPVGDEARVELLRRVAADALRRGAPAAAVAWLRRALAEPPPPEVGGTVLLELATAELRIAAPEATEHLATAVELIREPEPLSRAVRLLANAYTWARESDRAVEVLAAAVLVVEPADRELALLIEADLAGHAQEASREARIPAARRLERYAGLQGATPGERLVLACLAFERARASSSERDAAAHLERALAGGRLLAEQDIDVPPPVYVLVVGLLATDALDLADEVMARMLADARARVSVPAIAFVVAHQAVSSVRRGALARAEAEARTALDLLTAHDIPLGGELALGVLVEALVEQGDVDAADRALTASGLGDDILPGMPTNRLLQARGELRLAQGRATEAVDDIVEFGRRDELWGGASPLAARWRSQAALALAAAGDTDRARRMALDDLDRARRWGAASGIGIALRAGALVEGGESCVERLREAADVLERSPARLQHARALTDLGAALRRANRRRDARQSLQAGLRLAEECGARPLVDRARTELRAAGGRSSDPWGAGAQRLTASERRVAELAAEGLSNPEIAQALFVTRKTVETHLGSVYRKLGISGRGKLHRVLGPESASARG